MNWSKYRHNKRDMSKAQAQRMSYQAQIAPRQADVQRKQALLDARQEAEKQERIAVAAENVAEAAGAIAVKAEAKGDIDIGLTAERIEQLAIKMALLQRNAVQDVLEEQGVMAPEEIEGMVSRLEAGVEQSVKTMLNKIKEEVEV